MSNAAQRKPGEANPIVQMAILVAILAVVLNAGFYFLSEAYFEDRAKRFGALEMLRLPGARWDFGIFTVFVGGAAVLAVAFPRVIAHGIPALAGLAALVAALAGLDSDISVVLVITLFVVAGVFELVIWQSHHRLRAGWAMLSAMCVVCAVVTLFGAPKIRDMLGVGMWIALIVPGLLGAATAALGLIRDDYREAA